MLIYYYDENTNEYLYSETADSDPEESKIKGEFVPLIPANATLKEVPGYNQDNEIPVFENDNWIIKPDYRKNYYKVDDNLNVLDIDTIGEQTGIIVDKTTGDLIKQNPDKYKIEDDTVVEKTSEEYEQEQAQKEAQRIAMLNLTGADVERGIYKAKGMDFDDVIALVEQYNQTAPLDAEGQSAAIDIKALKIELKANNFYRGNPYINAVGTLLGFTSDQLDEFFETGDYTTLLT